MSSDIGSRSGAVAAVAVVALCLVGCSAQPDDGQSDGSSPVLDMTTIKEGYLGEDAPGDPVSGGTLTLGTFNEPRSLDPAVTIAALTTGGTEMLAIYDSLLRYDARTQEFVPHLAESLETEDEQVWTLRLREGVRFSNGEPVDAAAVTFSQERYASLSAPEAALWNGNVVDISTPDERTVVYTLDKSWPLFPGLLTTGPGMIVAEESVGPGDEFTPIGAGPFTLGEWSPQEEIVLEANPDYWGGEPYLDQVRIAFMPNARTAVETMASGALDATFVREPDQVEEELSRNTPGYVSMTAAQNVAIINAAEGRPGADVRVRRALQLAIDPESLTERAFSGAGGGSSTIFPEYSRWHTETAGLPYDPDEARRLLDEAKADGFDGKIEYIENTDPTSRALALGIKAQLEAVGFEVELNLLRTVADLMTAVVVEQDYDVSTWGYSFREADPYPKMFATLHSEGNQNYGVHTSPEMDGLLEEFQVAGTYEEQLAVMDRIQQWVNEDVPFLVFGPYAEVVIWNDDVRGVVGTANSMVMFGEAWKGQ